MLRGVAVPMVSVRLAVAVSAVGVALSVTVTVKVDVPVLVGVPLMIPVAGSRARPAGSDPDMTANVSAPVPPVTAICVAYSAPRAPFGSAVAATVRAPGAAMVIEMLSVAVFGVGVELSVAVSVAVNVPAVVGVPEMVPTFGFKVSPPGSAPSVTA